MKIPFVLTPVDGETVPSLYSYSSREMIDQFLAGGHKAAEIIIENLSYADAVKMTMRLRQTIDAHYYKDNVGVAQRKERVYLFKREEGS